MIRYPISKSKVATAWAVGCAALAFVVGMVDVLARVNTGTDVIAAYGAMLNVIPGLTVAVLAGCIAILSMGADFEVIAPNEPRISKAYMVLIPVASFIGSILWISARHPVQWALLSVVSSLAVLVGGVLSAVLAGVKINKASA